MPNIKSQKKRVLTNDKSHLANEAEKSRIKTSIKAVLSEVEAKDAEKAQSAYNTAAKYLDKAVTTGIYHKNYASRQKARLSKAVNSLK